MFRTKDESEQFLHPAKGNRSQRSLSSVESDQTSDSLDMVQRDTGSNWPYAAPTPALETASEVGVPLVTAKPAHGLRALLQRVYERLTENDWERQRREREEYLAQSVDLYDLEDRMRRFDRFHSERWERGL